MKFWEQFEAQAGRIVEKASQNEMKLRAIVEKTIKEMSVAFFGVFLGALGLQMRSKQFGWDM